MCQKPYYLVAIPEGEVMQKLQRLQAFMSRRFRMYEVPYPQLHLTVGVIEKDREISGAFSLLEKIAANCEPFSVQVKGERCFGEPFLSVGVDINSPKLAYLAGRVEGGLISRGFTPRTFNCWNFHISLIHPQYARRTWTPKEFREACLLIRQHAPEGSCRIRALELWEPEFPPLKNLKAFPFEQ